MESTQVFIRTVRTRMLDYTPPAGSTLRTLLGGGEDARLYTHETPADDEPTYPYAVVRIASRPQTDGYGGLRSVAGIEVQVFDRPRSQLWRAEGIADRIEQSMLGWAMADTPSIVFARHVRRMTLPPAPSPMDRDLIVITLTVPVVVWPDYLLQTVL
jgi:hypothetical protein